MTQEQNTSGWKLIGHSRQIADTGDYDGHYEITNGKISLLTQDDDDEALHPIVDALNDSGCKFYQDDWLEFENKLLKDDKSELRERAKGLESQLAKLQAELEFYKRRADHNPNSPFNKIANAVDKKLLQILDEQKKAGKKFISDEEVDKLMDKIIREELG